MKKETFHRFWPLIVIILCLPLLMGQQDCQVNEALIRSLQQLVQQKFQPAPGQKWVYVANLSFMDAQSKTIMMATQEAELINNAVRDGIYRATKVNPSMKYDEPGHTIPNTDGNVNKMLDILFDPGTTPEQKMDEINNQILDPNGIDVLVSGQYMDKQHEIHIRPIAIAKHNKKLVAKNLVFTKNEYICPDTNNPSTKALCPNAHEEIAKTVEELLQAL